MSLAPRQRLRLQEPLSHDIGWDRAYENGGDVIRDTSMGAGLVRFFDNLPKFGDPDLSFRPSRIPAAGNGVFAERAFEKGEPISRYDGIIVPRTLSDRFPPELRAYQGTLQDGRLAHTVMQGDTEPVVGHGLGSLVNDTVDLKASRVGEIRRREGPSFRINAELFIVVSQRALGVDEDTTVLTGIDVGIIVKAIRQIESGDEIYVKYGDDYWNTAMSAVAPEPRRAMTFFDEGEESLSDVDDDDVDLVGSLSQLKLSWLS